MKSFRIALHALILFAATSAAAVDGNAEAGLALYQARCAACHSIEFNGAGPAHRGVFGRQAGMAKGFAYSEALKHSGLVWDEVTLNRWLENPERTVPGQRMGINVPDEQDRADLIAYLRKYAAAR
ncbi:MAG TPA: c-type cytochrome [Burkholderiaceae bacterium]|nr:c-type cytochrome [Burkholderiaceae bacterium]